MDLADTSDTNVHVFSLTPGQIGQQPAIAAVVEHCRHRAGQQTPGELGAVVTFTALTGSEIAGARGLISNAEKARAERFRNREHGNRFAAAHAILRQLIACKLGLQLEEIEFATGAHGKPELAAGLLPGGKACHFNLSYSGNHFAIALAERPVGVDIEMPRPRAGARAIAERVFSTAENCYLNAGPAAAYRERFYRIWTRKEALLKAMAEGLQDIAKVDVMATTDRICVPPASDQCYQIASLSVPPDLPLAIALRCP